jgi:hypothetical protein
VIFRLNSTNTADLLADVIESAGCWKMGKGLVSVPRELKDQNWDLHQ